MVQESKEFEFERAARRRLATLRAVRTERYCKRFHRRSQMWTHSVVLVLRFMPTSEFIMRLRQNAAQVLKVSSLALRPLLHLWKKRPNTGIAGKASTAVHPSSSSGHWVKSQILFHLLDVFGERERHLLSATSKPNLRGA